jgi:membrane-associated phospholipid phosphatase
MLSRVAALLGVISAAPAARADEPVTITTAVAPSVRWQWPRFRWWEYGGTIALGASTWAYDRYGSPPEQPRWSGGILFDGAVRGWLRADSLAGRESAGRVSDLLWMGGSLFPFLVDLPVALIAHKQPGVAWQLLMMDLEAFAVAGMLNRLLEFEVGRARPSRGDCARDPAYDALCGSPSNNASFPSGHTLSIATSAGLTCIHHRYLPLYGQPLADGAACALLSAATAATAVSRIVADRHHASDVLFGASLGFATGYALPWLLHYRSGRSLEPRAALVPLVVGPRGIGAAMVGGF